MFGLYIQKMKTKNKRSIKKTVSNAGVKIQRARILPVHLMIAFVVVFFIVSVLFFERGRSGKKRAD